MKNIAYAPSHRIVAHVGTFNEARIAFVLFYFKKKKKLSVFPCFHLGIETRGGGAVVT